MPKQKLRQLILAKRRALAASDVRVASLAIQQAFIESPEFAKAKVLALYAPVHNEVDTAGVLAAALAAQKKVLYPVVFGDSLLFRRVLTPDQLRKGAFGILEPAALCDAHDPCEADLIVLPGVAFDAMGRRIGYGKGYYDRALHPLEGKGKLIGFCYDFQVVDDIAGEPHDVKMDLLITEKRVVCPRD
jgi:5-formyltetrahydrofolate cyclo-ligase